VAEQLDDESLLTQERTLVLHAGKDYYEELLPLIEDSGVSVEMPTEGLYIGEKKAWYKERI
jgi:cytosine/adenosine deaminase-related metal-dependent hydrolase